MRFSPKFGHKPLLDLNHKSTNDGLTAMQTIQSGYRGLNLLFKINMDRLLFVAAIPAALYIGAFLGSM